MQRAVLQFPTSIATLSQARALQHCLQVAMYLQADMSAYAAHFCKELLRNAQSGEASASNSAERAKLCAEAWAALQLRHADLAHQVVSHHPVIRSTDKRLEARFRELPPELHVAALQHLVRDGSLLVEPIVGLPQALSQLTNLQRLEIEPGPYELTHELAGSLKELPQLQSLSISELQPGVAQAVVNALLATNFVTELALGASDIARQCNSSRQRNACTDSASRGAASAQPKTLSQAVPLMTQLRHLALRRLPLTESGYRGVRDKLVHLTHLDFAKCYFDFEGRTWNEANEHLAEYVDISDIAHEDLAAFGCNSAEDEGLVTLVLRGNKLSSAVKDLAHPRAIQLQLVKPCLPSSMICCTCCRCCTHATCHDFSFVAEAAYLTRLCCDHSVAEHRPPQTCMSELKALAHAGQKALRHLDLAWCSLCARDTHFALRRMPCLSELASLTLEGNFRDVSSASPYACECIARMLSGMTSLTRLDLSSTAMGEGLTTVLSQLSVLTGLADLRLVDCQLSRTVGVRKFTECAAAMQALRELDIRNNVFMQQAVCTMQTELTQLQHLLIDRSVELDSVGAHHVHDDDYMADYVDYDDYEDYDGVAHALGAYGGAEAEFWGMGVFDGEDFHYGAEEYGFDD